MKILLISPGITHFGIIDCIVYTPSPPLSLAYLASYIRNKGYENVIIRDLLITKHKPIRKEHKLYFGWRNEEVLNLLEHYSPDLVGITSMYTRLAFDIHKTASLVKYFSPDIPVIVGGSHASQFPELTLKDKNIDVVCIGEGEETFYELVKAVESRNNIFNIPGTCVRKDGKFHRNEKRSLIKSLDSLPFPARDLLDMEEYIRSANSPYIIRDRQTGITTSRGCPQNCIFCTVKSIWGRTWRGISAKNVVDEIESLMIEYNIKEVAWQDDSASVDKKRLSAICDEIIRRNIDIKMTTPNGIAYWTLDEELMEKMLEAGFYRITLGIESANPETLKFIRKNIDLNRVKKLVEHANKIGMWITSTNIIGFPYETKEQIMDTISFQINSGFDLAVFYFLQPNPCSDVYQYFKKEGLLNLDNALNFSDKPVLEKLVELNSALNFEIGVDNIHLKKEEIRQLMADGYRRFMISRFKRILLKPWIILRKIHSFEDVKFLARLLPVALRILLRSISKKVGLVELLWAE